MQRDPVDEYQIAIDRDSGFPVVLLTFKSDDGSLHGPFELVPAYAHKLADELCIASARAAAKVSSEPAVEVHSG